MTKSGSALLNKEIIAKNNKIKFIDTLPQANDFNQIIRIVNVLKNKRYATSAEILKEINLHERTLNYYLNAAYIFNLLDCTKRDNNRNYYSLTEEHKMKLEKNNRTQMFYYVRKLMKNDVIKHVVDTYLEQGLYLTNKDVMEYIKSKHPEMSLSQYTLNRRIDSVISWSKWTINHMRYIF